MFNKVALVIGFVVLVRGVITIILLKNSLIWFKNNFRKVGNNIEGELPSIFVIIPALREQKRIIQTIKYFLVSFGDYPINIIIATTNREFEKSFEGLSTQKLVENYIKQNRLESRVSVLNFPERYGKKAHQLNYVLDTLKDKKEFIAVYDADSRPHKSTLDAFYRQVSLHPEAEVFQQSALFFNNFNTLGNSFLKASAVLQSRWTLAHEMARLLRQSGKDNIFSKMANAHCVGHGLIIKFKTLNKIGGFPEETMNEDLALGYLLRTKELKFIHYLA